MTDKLYPHGKKGFASMDPAKHREIASKGGKAAHALGRAHEWTRVTAQAAGRKGGSAKKHTPATTTPGSSS